ncbi:MAG: MEDS domain-containing protein [Nitrososphaeraceae archaeon]
MTTDKENVFCGHASEVSVELKKSAFGSHFLVIYPDLLTLREMYSHYIKSALSDEGNEIVIILPFLETVNNVRWILSEDSANIDVRKYEKEQTLLIIDSLKGYLGSQEGFMPFVRQTVEYAKTSGKNGLSVLGDMGSFFYIDKKDLLKYEMALPTTFEKMNLKGFCLYHKNDFDRRLTEKERQTYLEHHGKTLILLHSANGN